MFHRLPAGWWGEADRLSLNSLPVCLSGLEFSTLYHATPRLLPPPSSKHSPSRNAHTRPPWAPAAPFKRTQLCESLSFSNTGVCLPRHEDGTHTAPRRTARPCSPRHGSTSGTTESETEVSSPGGKPPRHEGPSANGLGVAPSRATQSVTEVS